MRAIIFANGDLNDGPAVRAVLDSASDALCVAADGGAYHAETAGRTPDLIIGDMDSLRAEDLQRFEAAGVTIKRYLPEKDETDLELALLYAVGQGADWIRVIGGIGDRLDQTFANVLLLTLPALAGCDVRFVAGRQQAWLISAGEHRLRGQAGDTLSLIPVGGDACGVATAGLAYPLRGENLRFGPARGVSNVLEGAEARIRFEAGQLLVVHTLGRA